MGLSGEVTGNQDFGVHVQTQFHMVLCIKQGKEHGELGICDTGAFLHIYCMSIKLVVKVRNAREVPQKSSRKGTICLRHNILVTDLLNNLNYSSHGADRWICDKAKQKKL